MLDMRPDCERCGKDLPAEKPGAFICSFECTFCTICAEELDDNCPNCGGELMDRQPEQKSCTRNSRPQLKESLLGDGQTTAYPEHRRVRLIRRSRHSSRYQDHHNAGRLCDDRHYSSHRTK